MYITWLKCSEKSPPKSPTMKVILRTREYHYVIVSGLAAYLTIHMMYLPYKIRKRNIFRDTSWTPYTKEKWEFLNN